MVFIKSSQKRLLILLLLQLYVINNACADQVYLKNKDRLTGAIIKETSDAVDIKTSAMGIIKINKKAIDKIIKDDKQTTQTESSQQHLSKPKPEIIWTKTLKGGYNLSTGNTQKSALYSSIFLNRNHLKVNETTLRADAYYSSTDKKMDSQKWYAMARYAYSFGMNKRWYNFFRFEADHDRFADIDYRLLPAAGVGYWISDSDDMKFLVEAALGWEHTVFNTDDKKKNDAVLTPRAYFEKKLFSNSKISQDIYYYPALDDFVNYRLHSETVLSVALNDKLSLNLSLIDDYNSRPKAGAEKNDLRLISSLGYSF
jgi:putative salt-induced outer membrane protein YdiY